MDFFHSRPHLSKLADLRPEKWSGTVLFSAYASHLFANYLNFPANTSGSSVASLDKYRIDFASFSRITVQSCPIVVSLSALHRYACRNRMVIQFDIDRTADLTDVTKIDRNSIINADLFGGRCRRTGHCDFGRNLLGRPLFGGKVFAGICFCRYLP